MDKILIVEDDSISSSVLEKMLDGLGSIDKAVDGALGLGMFTNAFQSSKPYTLVFLDVMMPIMNGFECLRQMRILEELYPEKKKAIVILTTTIDRTKSEEYGYDKQWDEFLMKPVAKIEVMEALKKYGKVEVG